MPSSEINLSLRNLAKKHRISGFSIQLIDKFQLGDYFAYGTTSDTAKNPINNKTLFQAASLSKTVAALVALRLVEEKQLEFNSIKNFLSHSAGISVNGFEGYEINEKLPRLENIINGTIPANSKSVIKKYQTGRYRYSGGGYMLVQKMLQDISGQSFIILAKKYVFDPLKMKRSTFKLLYPDTQTNIAYGHAPRKQLQGPWKIHPESAAAGLWTTPTEMAKIVIEIMKSLDNQESTFSNWIAKTMTRPIVKGVGLGTFVHQTKSGVEFSHDGANVGYRSRYIGLPNGKGLVIMVSNDNGVEFINAAVSLIGKENNWGRFKIKL